MVKSVDPDGTTAVTGDINDPDVSRDFPEEEEEDEELEDEGRMENGTVPDLGKYGEEEMLLNRTGKNDQTA